MLNLYLKTKTTTIYLSLLFIVIFSGFFYYKNLPLADILLPAITCLIIMILNVLSGYSKFAKKYSRILKSKKNILNCTATLPAPTNEIEKQYTRIIRELTEKYNELSAETENLKPELLNFYSKWCEKASEPISSLKKLFKEQNIDKNSKIELLKIEKYIDFAEKYTEIDLITSDIEITNCDIKKIVRKSAQKFGNLFIEKNAKLNLTNCDVNLKTNEKWLVFALQEIIENGLTFMKSGQIHVRTENDVIYISDTGVGILKNELPYIFENGFTGFNSKMNPNSSGSGLFLCKKALNKLGHQITVESTVDSGTTFKIDLNQK